MKTIILASGSPRRKKLLEQIKLPFQVQVSSVDERYDPDLPARDIVQLLARRKAEDIAQQAETALTIGADTLVVFKNTILEKPQNEPEARHMLQQLSGNTHSVFTGVALCKTGCGSDLLQCTTFFEETLVTFGNVRSRDITKYVQSGSPMDKAGAYGIQDDYGALFVQEIKGDYNTVVGFPLYRFYETLQTFAPEYLNPSDDGPG